MGTMGAGLYFKFLISLCAGLTGLCLFLRTVVETVFVDWDPLYDFLKRRERARTMAFLRAEVRQADVWESSPRILTTRLASRQVGGAGR